VPAEGGDGVLAVGITDTHGRVGGEVEGHDRGSFQRVGWVGPLERGRVSAGVSAA
jgi:hypothetical protein